VVDGWKTTKSIRECAVIILTTSSSANDIDLCYTYGANLFVTKPLDVDILGRVLKRVISLVPSLRKPIDKNQFVMHTGAA
jgi:DNA-binding NarL/FixJ family response regulator